MRKLLLRSLLVLTTLAGAHASVLVATANFHVVVPDRLYRSAQPTPSRIAEWKARFGLTTIINLRGRHPEAGWYRDEARAAHDAGISLVDFALSSSHELSDREVTELLRILAETDGPVLVHCLRGADRTGLVAAIFAAALGHSETYAEFQLTPVFGHIPLWFLPAFAMDRSFEHAEPRLGFFRS